MATLRSILKISAQSLLASFGWFRVRCSREPRLLILTYHRILPIDHPHRNQEQPGMVTSPDALRNHIKLITGLGANPVHLDEWLEKSSRGAELPPLSVAFTFDDGWQDNYEHAFPVLRANDIPFTIFLVSKLIDTDRTFWPEQVLQLLTADNVPWEDDCFQWLTSAMDAVINPPARLPLELADADSVIGELKALDDETIYRNLALVYQAHPHLAPPHHSRAILNTAELADMAASGLARFGAHTQHHYRLNRLADESQLEREILACMDDIRSLGTAHTDIFCYPNGDITHKGKDLVKSRYKAACTTKTGWNREGCDPYDLHRFNLHDGNSYSPQRLLATIGRGLL